MKLQSIDQLLISNHFYLTPSDKCFFLGEYTSRKGYEYSETNQLILNLKKGLDKINTKEWKYKNAAIEKYGAILAKIFIDKDISGSVFVPVPPSKSKTDPLHDNRLVQVLEKANFYSLINKFLIKELVIQKISTEAFHENFRMEPGALAKLYEIDTSKLEFNPKRFIIFDDMLTTGSHFKAVQAILKNTFPNVEVVGLFLTRRALPVENDFEPCS